MSPRAETSDLPAEAKPATPEELALVYRRVLDKLAVENPSKTLWCQSALCDQFARDLQEVLVKEGLSPKKITVRSYLGRRDGATLEHHTFLVDDTFGPGKELIIDPTYSQFFVGRLNPQDPRILLGTRSELRDFFSLNAARLDLYSLAVDSPAGWDTPLTDSSEAPRTFFDKLYGIGSSRIVGGWPVESPRQINTDQNGPSPSGRPAGAARGERSDGSPRFGYRSADTRAPPRPAALGWDRKWIRLDCWPQERVPEELE
ncbi:MAG: hypothetical protein ACHQ2Z_00040 [Elusimicrobiota bacterium]